MANKIIEAHDDIGLAIIQATNDVSKSKVNKAPYDQTYISSIIGVNRKFVDNISSDKQNDLIERFAIPETIEECEYNYYIFQINGTEYCARQNGSFMLYDKIMVYIPNGDWSNLYIEHFDAYTSGSSGSEISQPNWFVSPDAPGGDEPAEGDLWIMVNNENISNFTNITTDSYIKMYHYGTTDDEQVSKWRLTKTAVSRSSSTVDILNDEY